MDQEIALPPQSNERMSMPNRSFDAEYIREYFSEVDRMKPDGLLAWYADDASFRFSNQETARGKQAIGELLAGFYGTVRSMRHEPLGIWHDADSGAMEASAHFELPDGRTVELPAVSVLRVRNGLVHDFRFVMDASPLQQENG
jgi:ketosteroid isomerase-like protein